MDRVNWVTHECFNAVAELARIGPYDAVQSDLVRARMKGFVDGVTRKAREAGYPEQEGRLMAYAMAALADEVVMTQRGPLRDDWAAHTLQRELFGENLAGENFFVHLESVRQNPAQLDLLRVFYLCLLFGFQGRYRVRGADVALSDLVDGVRAQLLRGLPLPEVLAPNGARPEEGRLLDTTRELPVVWAGAGLVALALVLYLGLSVALRDELARFVAMMGQGAG